MFPIGHPRQRRMPRLVALVCGALLVVAGAGCGVTPSESALLLPAVSVPSWPAVCGIATPLEVATVDSLVATNIYHDELDGSETHTDLGYITGASDLLSALRTNNQAAVLKAADRLVLLHPGWHIVRLRILAVGGRVLADVGGPYVIAPVRGVLRFAGRIIGRFVMSVQDDVGFTKLGHRYIGNPIGIYVNGRLATELVNGSPVTIELGGDFPSLLPTGPTVNLNGSSYGVLALTYHAFPDGALTAVIALPASPLAEAAQSCASVALGETGRVVVHIAARFHPLASNYPLFVGLTHAETGAFIIIRDGARVLVDSNGPGPAQLPVRGRIRYQGRKWSVFSFAPTATTRVYLLVPA